MVWVFRVAVALIVAAYSAWLAGPLIAPFDGAVVAGAARAAVALVQDAPIPQGAF